MPIGSPKYAPVTQPGRRAATPHWGSLRWDRPAEPRKYRTPLSFALYPWVLYRYKRGRILLPFKNICSLSTSHIGGSRTFVVNRVKNQKMYHAGTLFSAKFWVRFSGRKSVSSILRGGKPQQGPKKIACGAKHPPSGGGGPCVAQGLM